jgi:flagellar biosynthesis/type III secretory pathway protein FliH
VPPHTMNRQQMDWRQEEQRALSAARSAFEAWHDAHHKALEAGTTEAIEAAYLKAKVAQERLTAVQNDCTRMLEDIRAGTRY